MPNHLPVLIEFSNSTKSINTIVSNGKRFIAYEIVKRLQEQDQHEIYLHTVSCCSTRLGVETRLGRGLTKFESKKFIPVSENKFSFTHKFFGTSSSAALAVIVKWLHEYKEVWAGHTKNVYHSISCFISPFCSAAILFVRLCLLSSYHFLSTRTKKDPSRPWTKTQWFNCSYFLCRHSISLTLDCF